MSNSFNEATISSTNCRLTRSCKNNECFYRQRDVHGLNPHHKPGYNDRYDATQAGIASEFGEARMPSFRVVTTPNVINLVCESYR